jgi:hypothetical protein
VWYIVYELSYVWSWSCNTVYKVRVVVESDFCRVDLELVKVDADIY